MTISVSTSLDDVRDSYRAGYCLPQSAYVDEDVFAREIEQVFLANWLFVTTSGEVPAGGHVTWSVGRESVVLARTADGTLHAHHNACRHRGSRLLPDGGGAGRTIVCGYHSWTYGLDGTLRAARDMGESFEDRCGTNLALRPVRVREVSGLVFVCFAEEPPPFDRAHDDIDDQLRPHQVENTDVIARYHYRVSANWKTLVENNRECYHCRPNHPEFCLSNFELGVNGDSRTNPVYAEEFARQRADWREQGLSDKQVSFPDGGFHRVARLPLRDGFETESMSGKLVAPLLGTLSRPGVGSVRVITLPNSWSHVNADYVVTTRLTPIRADITDVDVTFLVRGGADKESDYVTEDVVTVWKNTSEQDWELCEKNFAGVRSRGYVPGPLSPVTEKSVVDFHEWWLRQVGTPQR
ncbi:MAG: aromatic ring-hydroxylating dioxygenase subunit alpha [Actinomycetota bacterium]|nr:aromatic ring-hydroxylating dioxygenase subunit alpha [Actinomycetota bacterium]